MCYVHYCPCPCFEQQLWVKQSIYRLMSFGGVTTTCGSSPMDKEVSRSPHMQQNEFSLLSALPRGTLETRIKKIGNIFLWSTVLHSVSLRVLYEPLDDITCDSFFYKKVSFHNISFTFNESLCFQVASAGNVCRHCVVGTICISISTSMRL